MNPFAICILLSAFLLFQIQPIISKTLLPWFGGTPTVWSSAMLFFQLLLTGGYAWSNWLVRRKGFKKQTIIHLFLMAASVVLVVWLWVIWPSPVTLTENLRTASFSNPILHIFLLLGISVGLPFFVLSTNSPLMQVWFERRNPGRSPYWLYALSNIGSFVGLITYPILIEPLLTIPQQGWVWAGGYLLFVLLAGFNAFLSLKAPLAPIPVGKVPKPAAVEVAAKGTQAKWILLSTCASLLLLAVTSQITQEVAVIPFLWVLPLSIYLLSFVLTFSNRPLYHKGFFTALLFISTAASLLMLAQPQNNIIVQIIIYNVFLFAACMVCNGELYALRPQASGLTRFYLLGSIGGALGGLFVNLIAPLIFRGYWEFYIGIIFVWFLLWISQPQKPQKNTQAGSQTGFLGGVMMIVVSMLSFVIISNSVKGNSFTQRNFYGVVTVRQSVIETNQQSVNILAHGITLHGFQFLDPTLRDTPTSYYSTDSGVGLAILNHPKYGQGMKVGVLGLGIGTLAAYGQPGDSYRFYEINPVMVDLANGQGGYFSFLKDSQAVIEIVTGDARISLDNELAAGLKNEFDLLVLDTFNSDSIPVHLVTRQAFEIYLQNLAPDGLIAVHISNRRLDLRPVFWQVSQHFDLQMGVVQVPPQGNDPTTSGSTWVLLTRNPDLLENPALAERLDKLEDFRQDTRLWTDDYSNLIQLLR